VKTAETILVAVLFVSMLVGLLCGILAFTLGEPTAALAPHVPRDPGSRLTCASAGLDPAAPIAAHDSTTVT